MSFVKQIKAVKVGRQFTSFGKTYTTYKTFHTPSAAAREWASNVSFKLNQKYDYKDGYIIDTVAGACTEAWPIYDRAYRRALPIFKKLFK